MKKQQIENMLTTIPKTMHALKGGEPMTTNDTFSPFNDPTYQKYKDEVEKKWGNTDAYKQSMQRVKNMSKKDLQRVKADSEAIANTTKDLMLKGFSSDSKEVQEQMDRFYRHLHAFYDPSYEMFKGLGQMYVDDPRFTKVYEKRARGLALFMRDAMAYYADKHLSIS